jgi:hypothetical protein
MKRVGAECGQRVGEAYGAGGGPRPKRTRGKQAARAATGQGPAPLRAAVATRGARERAGHSTGFSYWSSTGVEITTYPGSTAIAVLPGPEGRWVGNRAATAAEQTRRRRAAPPKDGGGGGAEHRVLKALPGSTGAALVAVTVQTRKKRRKKSTAPRRGTTSQNTHHHPSDGGQGREPTGMH